MANDNPTLWFHHSEAILPSKRLMQLFKANLWQLPPLYVLPPDVPTFVGRQIELNRAIATLRPGVSTNVRPLVVLSGPSGIGKSALAVHIAHSVKRFFPDLWLCIDLKGAEPQPLNPDAVIVSLLQEWGIEPATLPHDLTARVQLLHSLMAGKRTLIVLDNAASVAQIQPLIPSSPTCAVIVTSRNPLPDLQGATTIALDQLLETDALQWLLETDKRQVRTISINAASTLVQFSNRIPLVLRLIEGALRSSPNVEPEIYAMLLRQSSVSEVATCFATAYRTLPVDAARLLRLLGLLTDMHAAPSTVSALLDCDLELAQQTVKTLLEAQLVEPMGDRVRVHDLIRPLIRHQLAAEESTITRKTTRLRLAHAYLETLALMAQSLNFKTCQQLVQHVGSTHKQPFDVIEQKLLLTALRWYETEKLNLQALLEWAHHTGTWDVMFSLIEHLALFFHYRADWNQWQDTHKQALQIAQQMGDRLREAQILNSLGNASVLQGQWSKACEYYETSLNSLSSDASPHWKAQTLANLGVAHAAQDNLSAAATCWESALTHLNADGTDYQDMMQWMEITNSALFEEIPQSGSNLRTSRLLNTLSGMFKRLILE